MSLVQEQSNFEVERKSYIKERKRERERERDFSCFEISFYVKLILLYDRKYSVQINGIEEMKKEISTNR